MVNNIDYYALLGVDSASAPDEISQAYHRLARQYHPDLHPHDTDADIRFKEINEAYQALSDPERRAQYDLQRASAAQSSVDAAAAPTEPATDEQAVVYEQSVVVHSENLEEVMDEFSAALTDAANQVADELRGAMQDFAAELDEITRSVHETAGNRASRRHGFPPPPPKGNPGRAPKPKNL